MTRAQEGSQESLGRTEHVYCVEPSRTAKSIAKGVKKVLGRCLSSVKKQLRSSHGTDRMIPTAGHAVWTRKFTQRPFGKLWGLT